MTIEYLNVKKKWKPFRFILNTILSLLIIGIGLTHFDSYFYVWIYVFLNIAIATTISLILFFFTIPIFREKESSRNYTHFDRVCIYTTIIVGLAIIFFNIVGLITIPKNFHPIYKLDIEKTIRLAIFVIYCFVAEFLISVFCAKISLHLKNLRRNSDPNDDFTISTNLVSNKQLSLISKIEKIVLFMSCYFEALFISGIIYFICSFLLSPYTNPTINLLINNN